MRVIRRLLGYVKPYLSQLIVASILLAVSGALMSAVVATIKPLVNKVLLPAVAPDSDLMSQADRGSDILTKIEDWLPVDRITEWALEHAFVQVPLLIIVIFFIRGLFLYFGQYLTIKAGVSVIRDLRTDLYESVAYQSLGFFQAHSTGTILSRIINDVFRLQRVTTIVLAAGIQAPVKNAHPQAGVPMLSHSDLLRNRAFPNRTLDRPRSRRAPASGSGRSNR